MLWGREDYQREATRQLSDTSTYRELSAKHFDSLLNTTTTVKDTICSALLEEGCITTAEAERLRAWTGKPSRFYLLPKVHKEKRPDTNTFAGRPVVASCGSCLRPLDEYAASLVSTLGKNIPGTLQDTTALLLDLEKTGALPAGAILFSADVENLYPSIPWKEGIEAATEYYRTGRSALVTEARRAGRLPPPSAELFGQIVSSIITLNAFSYQEGRFFRQLKGTAMGCSISVFFANAFLYKRSKPLINSPPLDLWYLGRYIDDLIGIWLGRAEDIPGIFKDVTDDHIKLTYVIGGDKLEALDLEILITDTHTIVTRLFTKPTGGSYFIPWDSNHPRGCKEGIVYSQLLRLRRNCTRLVDFDDAAMKLIEVFRSRGYPNVLLEKTLERVRSSDRAPLLTQKTKKDTPSITYVATYHPSQPARLKGPLGRFWQSLRGSRLAATRQVLAGTEPLQETNPRLAFRLPKALGWRTGVKFKKGGTIQKNKGRTPPVSLVPCGPRPTGWHPG